MAGLNQRIYIVDREDQVKWFLDVTQVTSFCIQLKDNHHTLRHWLETMAQDVVVISGQGVMPRVGTEDHPYHSLLKSIQRDQFKVYFQSEQDALAFKLAWGGSL